MEAICGICEEVLGDRPRTELLCHHFFHTHCTLVNVLTGIHNNILEDFQCPTCHQHVFPQQEEQEEEAVEDHQSVESYNEEHGDVNTLYNTNIGFRNDIKKYINALRQRSKPRAAFRKVCSAKKTELAARCKQIKEHVQALHSVKKDEILQSEEYKAYRTVEARCSRYYHFILRKYNLRNRDLRRLSRLPGCKSLQGYRYYWRDSPHFIIRRALRLYLRCY